MHAWVQGGVTTAAAQAAPALQLFVGMKKRAAGADCISAAGFIESETLPRWLHGALRGLELPAHLPQRQSASI